jgi:hypothetical protein
MGGPFLNLTGLNVNSRHTLQRYAQAACNHRGGMKGDWKGADIQKTEEFI